VIFVDNDKPRLQDNIFWGLQKNSNLFTRWEH